MINRQQWQAINNIFLDMDGTLLDLHFDNYFWRSYIPEQYAQAQAISVEQAQTYLTASYQEKQGTLDWYCLDFWSQRLQLDIAAHKLALKDHIAFRPMVLEFLQRLQQDSSKQVSLVTNAHQKTLSIKLEQTGIAPYFDHLVSSHDFGAPKEQQQFWQDIAGHLDFDPATTLFIDDSFPVLRAAREFGIGYILGIRLPDTKAPPLDSHEFTLLDDFQQLMDFTDG